MQADLEKRPVSPAAAKPANENIHTTAPGQIRVIKRNGTVVPYTSEKIAVAITKAFLAIEGGTAAASTRIRETVVILGDQVSATFKRRMPSGGTIHIEDIQDQVELALMRSGEHKVAQAYVIYRAEHAKQRAEDQPDPMEHDGPTINVIDKDGNRLPLDILRLNNIVKEACNGVEFVEGKAIIEGTLKNLYDGVSLEDVSTSLVMTARTLIEEEPNYTYVTARLLLDQLRREALSFLNLSASATHEDMRKIYPKALSAYLSKGIELELLSPELKKFDIERLGRAIDTDRDRKFAYLGLQTLYDRYFIHSEEVRIELPQIFFMRVAMGLAPSLINDVRRSSSSKNMEPLRSQASHGQGCKFPW